MNKKEQEEPKMSFKRTEVAEAKKDRPPRVSKKDVKLMAQSTALPKEGALKVGPTILDVEKAEYLATRNVNVITNDSLNAALVNQWSVNWNEFSTYY